MHKRIKDFQPKAVIVDPISNLVNVGSSNEVNSMLLRMIDFLKLHQITALLTLDAKARLPLTIPATLSYQGCQGASCYPPKKVKFDIAVGGEAKQK